MKQVQKYLRQVMSTVLATVMLLTSVNLNPITAYAAANRSLSEIRASIEADEITYASQLAIIRDELTSRNIVWSDIHTYPSSWGDATAAKYRWSVSDTNITNPDAYIPEDRTIYLFPGDWAGITEDLVSSADFHENNCVQRPIVYDSIVKCGEYGVPITVCETCHIVYLDINYSHWDWGYSDNGYYEYAIAQHHFMPESYVVDPKCEQEGVVRYKCQNCSETTDGAVPNLGHDWSLVSKTVDKYYNLNAAMTCNRCGKYASIPSLTNFGPMMYPTAIDVSNTPRTVTITPSDEFLNEYLSRDSAYHDEILENRFSNRVVLSPPEDAYSRITINDKSITEFLDIDETQAKASPIEVETWFSYGRPDKSYSSGFTKMIPVSELENENTIVNAMYDYYSLRDTYRNSYNDADRNNLPSCKITQGLYMSEQFVDEEGNAVLAPLGGPLTNIYTIVGVKADEFGYVVFDGTAGYYNSYDNARGKTLDCRIYSLTVEEDEGEDANLKFSSNGYFTDSSYAYVSPGVHYYLISAKYSADDSSKIDGVLSQYGGMYIDFFRPDAYTSNDSYPEASYDASHSSGTTQKMKDYERDDGTIVSVPDETTVNMIYTTPNMISYESMAAYRVCGQWDCDGYVVPASSEYQSNNGIIYSTYSVDGQGTIVDFDVEYKGPGVFVGEDYYTEDLELTLVYDDDTSVTFNRGVCDYIDITPSSNTITQVGDNVFSCNLISDNSLTDDFTVPGIDVTAIKAEYTGPSIIVGKYYDKSDVVVTATFTDGSEREIYVHDTTITPFSTTITQMGDNVFDVEYVNTSNETLTSSFTVPGVDVTAIEAEYTGPSVIVGKYYNKSDVVVTATLTDGSECQIDMYDSNLTVTPNDIYITQMGDNVFDVEYVNASNDTLTSSYIVPGVDFVSVDAVYTGDSVWVGYNYDYDDVELTFNLSDGSNIKYTLYQVMYYPYLSVSKSKFSLTPDDAKIATVGNHTFDVSYINQSGQTLTTDYNVTGYTWVGYEAEYVGDPIKIGHDYSVDDVILYYVYSDGTKEPESLFNVVYDWEEGTITPSSTTINDYGNEFKYENTDPYYAGEAAYNVPGYTVDGLKVVYTGDPVPIGSDYDPEDLVITLELTGIPDKELDINDVTITPSSTTITSEQNDFTASYTDEYGEEFTCDFVIPGVKVLTGIDAEYTGSDITVGNEYNKSDIQVTASYNDNTTEVIDIQDCQFNTDTIDSPGDNTITVTYQGQSDDVTITGILIPISLTAEYTGESLHVGDSADAPASAFDVYVVYHNNTENSPSKRKLGDTEFTKQFVNQTVAFGDNTVNIGYTGNPNYNEAADDVDTTAVVPGVYHYHTIEAIYNGNAVPVDLDYSKSDVEVRGYYDSDNNYNVIPAAEWNANSYTIYQTGDNPYTVSAHGLTTDLVVPGYYVPEYIKAVYNGPDILVGNNYNRDDVTVIIHYEGDSDETPRFETVSDWTVDSYLVSNAGVNNYTVTYNNLTDTIDVNGVLNETSLVATYTGDDLPVGSEVNKDDVDVYVIYHNDTNDNPSRRKLNSNEWTSNSLVVVHAGTNTFTATYNNMTADYNVNGTLTIVGLSAEYKGDAVLVGSNYSKSDVEVNIVYHDNSTSLVNTDDWTASSLTVTTDGTNTFTATYNNMTADYNVTGYKTISGLEATYNGPSILVGENYNKDNVIVNVVYNDNSKDRVYDWTESGLTVTTVGNNTFTATYNDMTADYVVNGYKTATALVATYNGNDIMVGENYLKSDVEVKVIYNDNSEEVVTAGWDASSLTVTSVGANVFTATYNNMTADYVVNGYKTVTALTAVYNGDDILVGNNYDKNDVVVTAIYHDGSNEVVGNWTESGLTVTAVGDNTFTATYNGMTATYHVIGYKTVTALTAVYNGPSILVGENYNKDNVIVNVVYNDNSKDRVYDWTESGLTVTTVGNNTFTATYNDMTADYVVNGYKTAVSLSATYKGEPVLIGDKYDKSDVEVKLIYNDDSFDIIAIDDWTESGLTVTAVGDNTFTAMYDNMTATYHVIGYKTAVSLSATYKGEPVLIGDKYDKSDVEVKLIYNDDSFDIIAIDDWTESDLTVTKEGINTFTATYDNMSADYEVLGYAENGKNVKSLVATYNGPDIKVGEEYSKSDVIVKVLYDDDSEDIITNWTPESLVVKVAGNNTYKVVYNDMTANYVVKGYKEAIKITAVYNGPKILVGNNYDAKNVTVKIVYHDGSEEVTDKWVPSSLKVTAIGNNKFVATYVKSNGFTQLDDNKTIQGKASGNVVLDNMLKNQDYEVLTAEYVVEGYKADPTPTSTPTPTPDPDPQPQPSPSLVPTTPSRVIATGDNGFMGLGFTMSLMAGLVGFASLVLYRRRKSDEVDE